MKIFIRSFLRRAFLFLYPMPLSLARRGRGSVIMFPRQIDGARCISIGANTVVVRGSWVSAYQEHLGKKYNPRIEIGNDVRIGRNFMLTAIEEVTIGDGCLLSGDVFISDHSHGYQPSELSPAQQPLIGKGPVRIGRNCFIGIRVSIMSGVTLGDYCVVGAHSVVTKSFPERSVVAGVPARLVKTLAFNATL